MRQVGRTWDNKRTITQIDARGHGPLYRTTFGNIRTEHNVDACDWCDKTDGKLYGFDYDIERARQRDAQSPGKLFCSLHCWGQDSGATDL